MKNKDSKLKILAASELEGDSKQALKLAKQAQKERVDLVVLCGDLTGWVETQNLIKPFKDRNQKVLLIPGNHDNFATADFLATLYGMKNIHGYSAIYKNIGFFGAGGADTNLAFPGHITERQIFETLKQAHAGIAGIEKKIMVTHMHPQGSKSEFSGIQGSKAIKQAIDKFKPALLLHGHIHEAEGAEEYIGKTKVINVGRNGRIIEI